MLPQLLHLQLYLLLCLPCLLLCQELLLPPRQRFLPFPVKCLPLRLHPRLRLLSLQLRLLLLLRLLLNKDVHLLPLLQMALQALYIWVGREDVPEVLGPDRGSGPLGRRRRHPRHARGSGLNEVLVRGRVCMVQHAYSAEKRGL